MSKKAIRILATVVVLGGAFVTLLATSLRENTQFYKMVDEVMPVASEWYGKPLQLHGYVVDGSIERGTRNALNYRFQIRNGESVVSATYTGIVPDTFQDGAEVVLKGRLSEAGFQVEPGGVMAKCPSKYEASTAPNLTSQGLAQ